MLDNHEIGIETDDFDSKITDLVNRGKLVAKGLKTRAKKLKPIEGFQ